MQLTATLQFLS